MRQWGGIAAVVVGVVVQPAGDAHAFCNGVFISCVTGGHDSVTEEGFSGLVEPRVVRRIVDANAGQDGVDYDRHIDDWAQHNTSCMFGQSGDFVNAQYQAMGSMLDPVAPDALGAAAAWGRALHTIQDFYAHSNYVELLAADGDTDIEGDEIAFPMGGWFPTPDPLSPLRPGSDIVWAQRPETRAYPAPEGYVDPTVSVALAGDSAIPDVWIDGVHHRGLTTGWNPDEDGEVAGCFTARTPLTVVDQWSIAGQPRLNNLVHGGNGDLERPCSREVGGSTLEYPTSVCLNKDRPNRPGHDAAFTLAAAQTRQEWCRMLDATVGGPHGARATNAAVGLFGAPGADLQPADLTCAPTPGPVRVDVRLLDTTVDHPSGQRAQYGFTALSDDLGAIERAAIAANAGERHPGTDETLSLCVASDARVVVGVWGWETPTDWLADGAPLGGANGSYPLADAIVSTQGATGIWFRAEIDVEPDGDDIDGDDLSSCGEAFYGSDPANPYTDEDPWPDGYEVNTLGTHPANPDTDGDYVWDAENTWFGTDPLNPDTDGDGSLDGVEISEGTDPLRWEIRGPAEIPCSLSRDEGCVDSDKDGVDDARDPSALAAALDRALRGLEKGDYLEVAAWLEVVPEQIEAMVRDDRPGAAGAELDPLFDVFAEGCVVRDKGLPTHAEVCAALVRLDRALAGL